MTTSTIAGTTAARRWVIWALPALVALAVFVLPNSRLQYLIAAALAVMVLAWAALRPAAAACVVVVVVALQGFAFGFMYGWHFPGFALRAAGGLKDVLGLGLVAAAVHQIRTRGGRLSRTDRAALIYVGVVSAYLLLPALFSPGSPLQWNSRLQAWRLDAGYVLLFVAARHIPWSETARRRLVRTVLAVGTVVVVFAIYQYLSPSGFARLVTGPGHQVSYELEVLHNAPGTVSSTLFYVLHTTGRPRVGSVLFSPFDMADYLLVVAAVLVERFARGTRHWAGYLLFAGVVFGLIVAQVRVDALALAVILGFGLLPAAGRSSEARWALLLMLVVGAAVAVPELSGTRFAGAAGGSASLPGHLRELGTGLRRLADHPLGLGLGNNPVTNGRFVAPGSGALTVDNAVLQVGDELGLVALLAWLAAVLGALALLLRRARQGQRLAMVAGPALAGVLIAGVGHHVFLGFSTAWTLWLLVGMALAERRPGAAAGP